MNLIQLFAVSLSYQLGDRGIAVRGRIRLQKMDYSDKFA